MQEAARDGGGPGSGAGRTLPAVTCANNVCTRAGSCRTAWEAEGEYFYEHPGGSTVPPRHHLGGNPCPSLSRQLSSALTSMLRTLLLASAQKAARMTVIERLKMLLDIFLRIQKDAINERFYCFSWRQGTLLAA